VKATDVFARGFKSWCETIALQRRRALALTPVDPVPPDRLAASLRIIVRGVEEVPQLDAPSRRILLHQDPDSWSAVTITDGSRSVVILNSTHSRGRSASDLMHELAHLIIGHRPGRVDLTEDGALMLNTYDRQQEDEANWLAGCLLLPRPALLWLRKRRLSLADATLHFGVSMDMLQYRLRVTGVDHQFKRTVALTGR
jgi:Zn-dependent peptidase ImmA (M78 family)